MSVKESKIVKGIAILSMVFYHLFNDIEKVKEQGFVGFGGSLKLFENVAVSGHVCVTLFVFVLAYGITMKTKKDNLDIKQSMQAGVSRYMSLAKKVSIALFAMLLLSFCFDVYVLPKEVWGGKIQQFLGILSNAFCVASVMGIDWYYSAWWFVSLAIVLFFTVPIIHNAIKKIGPIAGLILSVFLVRTLQFNVKYDTLPRYLICVVIGVVFAEYSILERIKDYFKKSKKCLWLVALLLICGICVGVRRYMVYAYILEAMFTVAIVLLTVLFVARLRVFRDVLAVLGNYSDYMWLTHGFVYNHLCNNLVFSHNNIWGIWIRACFFSFVFAFVLKKLQSIIKTERIGVFIKQKFFL